MARRVSWTNNSSGHSGTYVYRAETLDPQNLPAPVATVDPVAQGATAEWVDNEELAAGDYDYAVQDFDGQGVGALSGVVVYTVVEDFASAQIGDYIGGGVYAGINTESDQTEYHIIFANQEGELEQSAESRWKVEATETLGTDSDTDGWANTAAMETAGLVDHPAALHCRNYTGGGNTDWHLPARTELALEANIRGHAEMSTDVNRDRWTSTQRFPASSWTRRFVDGAVNSFDKDDTFRRVRPVRRVAV